LNVICSIPNNSDQAAFLFVAVDVMRLLPA
jgi:hypothetical protein